jgi:solute carrier family 35 protein F5
MEYWQGQMNHYRGVGKATGEESEEALSASQTRLLEDEDQGEEAFVISDDSEPKGILSVPETAKLSLEFCLLWFIANYLVAACLEHTSVASSTILTSTSSIWTLIFGAIVKVEHFSIKKLIGVIASLAGIILISSVDLSGKDNDENRGNFPHKSQGQIALGDAMAFGSAIMYGVYTVVMKKRIGNEDRVNMPLFFGLVGLFNVIFLWPGFLILHFTSVERFEFPPTGKIWTIVLVCSPCSPPQFSLTRGIVKFRIVLHKRLLLGLRDAPDYPSSSNCRSFNDYPLILDRSNDLECSVFQRFVLGRSLYCASVIFVHQSRVQG